MTGRLGRADTVSYTHLDVYKRQLEAAGRQVLTSETLPLNDGGIAAGQLWFAIHHLATHRPTTAGCATLSES